MAMNIGNIYGNTATSSYYNMLAGKDFKQNDGGTKSEGSLIIFENKVDGINNLSISSSERVAQSDEDKLQVFKKEIWQEINSWNRNCNVSMSIQITDSAFKRMMTDEAFKGKMMKLMKEDADVAKPPMVAGITWIDENGYRGIGYNNFEAGNTAFEAHSKGKNSFYVKKGKRNDIEDAWEKAIQNKKLQQKKREREYLESEYLKRYYKHQDDVDRMYANKM